MSCRVLHRGVEEALLAQVALESEMADLEQAGRRLEASSGQGSFTKDPGSPNSSDDERFGMFIITSKTQGI